MLVAYYGGGRTGCIGIAALLQSCWKTAAVEHGAHEGGMRRFASAPWTAQDAVTVLVGTVTQSVI